MRPFATVSEILLHGEGPGRVTFVRGQEPWPTRSGIELRDRALKRLHHLQAHGARPGDAVILSVDDNLTFVETLWAALLGGIIPVPAASGASAEHRLKLERIAHVLGDPFVMADHAALGRAIPIGESSEDSPRGIPHRARPGDTAVIQFSSGSTSEPKGIVLTHENIVANLLAIGAASEITADDVSLSWMPLSHDMGLMGMYLAVTAHGGHVHIMPTDLFVRRPLSWLKVASHIRATMLASPNFGLRHYLNPLTDDALADLDLSSVRVIYNGAEPISAALCREFMERLAPAKLPPNAMYPVYGLAEATLAVTFPSVGDPIRTICIDRSTAIGDAITRVDSADARAIEVVGEGKPIPESRVRIVNDDDAELPDDHVGHILISGANVTRGYFRDAAANARAFTGDGWLRTGDVGFVHDGEVFVSGRSKDIIFVDGQNYYPHDLEGAIERADLAEAGRVVASAFRSASAERDEIVVFVVHRGTLAEFAALVTPVARVVFETTGLAPAEVLPVKRIPKTTSGKVRRHALVESYASGEFATVADELRALRRAMPHHEIEEVLAGIVTSTLALPSIDANDNLFSLGASSRAIIDMHRRITALYPGTLELSQVFEFPTIAALARHIAEKN